MGGRRATPGSGEPFRQRTAWKRCRRKCRGCARRYTPTGNNQSWCAHCTAEARSTAHKRWYEANRGRVLRRAKERRAANPEASRQRARDWRRAHPGAAKEAWRLWKLKNPERARESDRRYNRRLRERLGPALYPHVHDVILDLCRDDPRRAVGTGSLAGPRKAICLECGETHGVLASHVARYHRMPTAEYRRKWGYAKNAALTSADVRASMSAASRRQSRRRLLKPPPVDVRRAVAARLAWGVAKQTRLQLSEHFRGKVPTRKPRRGRLPKTAFFAEAKRLHEQGGLSWRRIAKLLAPAKFAENQHGAADAVRKGVARLRPRPPR